MPNPKEQYIEDSVAAFSRKYHDPLRENIRINTDELRTALKGAWEGGMNSVLFLRCKSHGAVPQLIQSEEGLEECGECMRLKVLALYRERLRTKIYAIEGFPLADNGTSKNIRDNYPGYCIALGRVLDLLQENQSELSTGT